MSTNDIREIDLHELGRRFFAKEEDIGETALRFGREEIVAFIGERSESMASRIEELMPEQLSYRLSGRPGGWDASDDEQEFDISEIATHVAVSVSFYWFGIARALGHRLPRFPRAPREVRVTGKTGQVFGRGGWSGAQAQELAQLLRASTSDFLVYVSSLTEDEGKRVGTYEGYSELTVDGWLLLLAVHYDMHLKQIERMREQPDFPQIAP